MSGLILKIIACISMILDHTSDVLYNQMTWMNYIGRIAFPIYAFFIAEGYVYTKNLKKYLKKLLIVACISQIPFMIIVFDYGIYFNTIFTLIFGLLSIIIYDKNKIIGLIFSLVLSVIAYLCKFDYGFYGVLAVLLFYIYRDNKKAKSIAFVLMTMFYFLFYIIKYTIETKYGFELFFYNYLPQYVFTMFALIPIVLYNPKYKNKFKYFFYVIYPLHLTILSVIKIIYK